MRILELFSGYGTASFALKSLGIKYELVGYSDIDKYANQCFKQNHCPNDIEDKLRLGDCTKINPHDLEDFDLLTGGFPCQAFSVAGKGLGELDTRGTLFNEIIRIAEVKKPRYMLLENVKGLTNKRHTATFEKIKSELIRIGYKIEVKVLNTKEHGIPQNRERVFFVCFRDVMDWYNWKGFPEKEELKIFLKDILEDEVDEKYYLKQNTVDKLIAGYERAKTKPKENTSIMYGNLSRYKMKSPRNPNNKTEGISWCVDTSNGNAVIVGNVNPSGRGMNGNVYAGNVAPTITTNKGEGSKILQVGMIPREILNDNERQRRLYSPQGCSPSILNRSDSPKIIQKVGDRDKNNWSIKEDYANCIPANAMSDRGQLLVNNLTIRKLTPKECFRLQGFLNDEINLDGLSNTQRYKLAGNGQSVNVVKKIFKEIFK